MSNITYTYIYYLPNTGCIYNCGAGVSCIAQSSCATGCCANFGTSLNSLYSLKMCMPTNWTKYDLFYIF